jgi:hypothetical protein
MWWYIALAIGYTPPLLLFAAWGVTRFVPRWRRRWDDGE